MLSKTYGLITSKIFLNSSNSSTPAVRFSWTDHGDGVLQSLFVDRARSHGFVAYFGHYRQGQRPD